MYILGVFPDSGALLPHRGAIFPALQSLGVRAVELCALNLSDLDTAGRELAGIPEPGLHDIWRAFCLAQLQAGVPETTIARLMGHTTTQLIARYARHTGSDLRQHYFSQLDE